VENLVEAAVRFVVSKTGVSTALLGISSLEQLEQAAQYVERGPLPADVWKASSCRVSPVKRKCLSA
jgi:aryl-alcohol dehydrogenase-like predicted oxidoreductase